MENNMTQGVISRALLRFAVPLFVFLFACGLFHSRSFSYGRYLKKRLGQLALP